jgi:hypothetical protein
MRVMRTNVLGIRSPEAWGGQGRVSAFRECRFRFFFSDSPAGLLVLMRMCV